jgi:hypothetical protein
MNNMKQKITVLLVGFLLTLGISSCVKDSAPELGTRGNTIAKFNEGPLKNFFYTPFAGSIKTETFTFTRDVNSNAELNKAAEFLISEDPALVPAGYTELPTANFTYSGSDAGVILTSGKITAIRFAAGEVSKKIKMNLSGNAWTDVSVSYAKGYKVTDAGNNKVTAADNSKMVLTFGIKNKYDGVYEVTGTLVDLLGSRIAKGYPKTVELRTTGASQVIVCDNAVAAYFGEPYPLYFYGSPADNNPRYAFGVGFNFNSSDQLTSVFDAMDFDFEFTLGSGASNTYSNGVINVQWKTAANLSSFPIGRFTMTETYTYKGSRP